MTSQADIVLPLLHRYAMAIDMQRWNILDSVFTPDVTVDIGPVWTGLPLVRQAYEGFHACLDASCHTVGNPVWVFDGDRATVLSSVHAILVRADAPGGNTLQNWGWFEDMLSLQPSGSWRIAHRRGRIWRIEGNRGLFSADGGTELPFEPLSLKTAASTGQIGLPDLL